MTSTDALSDVGGRARRLARAVGYGVVVAVVIAVLTFLVRGRFDPLIDADEAAIRHATSVTRGHDGLRSFLLTWQRLSSPTIVYVVGTLACLWVWLRRHLPTRAAWAFVTMMVGWNLALDLKYVVRRARPVVARAIEHAPGYSFPSGHAANATIGASALVVLLWPFLRVRAAQVTTVAVAAAFVAVTCLDRVFLGVHFPSDVVAGVLLGVGLVLASYAGYLGWRPPTNHTKETP